MQPAFCHGLLGPQLDAGQLGVQTVSFATGNRTTLNLPGGYKETALRLGTSGLSCLRAEPSAVELLAETKEEFCLPGDARQCP